MAPLFSPRYLQDYFSGMSDNTVFSFDDTGEEIDSPSEEEAIASYWEAVGGYIRSSSIRHAQRVP